MAPIQQPIDCPNSTCASPAALALCIRFTYGFAMQIDLDGAHSARWDDVHCLVCGHFSSPYASGARQDGKDISSDALWLSAVDRALRLAKRGRLSGYLEQQQLGLADLLAMRRSVQRLAILECAASEGHAFPQVGVLRVSTDASLPNMFGVAHGEAESEPFVRKVHVLGRLLGADTAETEPRHCASPEMPSSWFFYHDQSFVGLLCLEPNRSYRGNLTIDGCLERLLRAS